jgi:hypothetical protein
MRAARANVRVLLHIQHRRPNSWADRGPHWYKHSLEQWTSFMGFGGRECALMRAPQTCAQHHTYRIGVQRAGPIEPQIGTKIHWGNGHKLWGRCARSAQSGRRSRPARARSAKTRLQGWNRVQQLPRVRSSSVGRALRAEQSKIVAYSQTDTGAKTSDQGRRIFVQP